MARDSTRYREEIRRLARDRGIELLLHFTQLPNLFGIVKHGLLPRSVLQNADYVALASSQNRLDGSDEAISISISGFNKTMFESKRRKSRSSDWVFLGLSPEILWTHDCRFFWDNAAKAEFKRRGGWMGGPWAFSKMFDGSEEERADLARSQPTRAESEVQVMENIAPELILAVLANSPRAAAVASNAMRSHPATSSIAAHVIEF